MAENKINVFVSILPQKYFVEQVGGDLVNVNVMVGPGQNPATYEPTPQQIVKLADAKLYFSIGVPFEKAWIEKIKQSNSNLIMINCCSELTDIKGDTHHKHDNEMDPHIWTSPNKVIQIVKLIEASLSKFDIKNTDTYKNSAIDFISELNKLNLSIESQLSQLEKKDLIVSHPSWSYYADQYGLKQISIEQRGKEIQAKSMVKLIKEASQKNIKAVFVQQQFSDKAAKVIAKELGAVIYELDPLAYNYIENINKVTRKIVEGLSL